MCTRGNLRRVLAALAMAALLPASWALAQSAPAAIPASTPAGSAATAPVSAAGPTDNGTSATAMAPASTSAVPDDDLPPFASLQPPTAVIAPPEPPKRVAAKKKKAAPAEKPAESQPVDPNSSRGMTHPDPLLLLGVVAFALYKRRYRDDDFESWYSPLPPDAPELLRNYPQQMANPRIVIPPELPKAFRMVSVSWTATVPGSGAALFVSAPAKRPEAAAAPSVGPAPAAESPAPAPQPTVTRVLLVGGEPEWVRFQFDVLRAEGAEVEVCDRNRRAVDILARSDFSVLIVDADATGDNSAPTIRRWLATNRPGMEKQLVVAVGNLCDARTSALLDEARALTLTRPCGVQDLLVMVRLASQRRAPATA